MSTPLDEIAQAVQSSMHSHHFEDIATGDVHETQIVETTTDSVKIICLVQSGESFHVTVTR